jgi:hypothetical protein
MTVASSYLTAQRPVILVDLFFPSQPVHFWTRPVSGSYDGKEYKAFGGLNSGLTFRNSLEQSIADVSVRLVGDNAEIRALALTTTFQRRSANIYIGNLTAAYAVDEVELLFRGVMSNVSLTDDEAEETVTIQIDGSLRSLFQPRTFRLSAADHALIAPDDSFFASAESANSFGRRFGD